MHNKDSFVIDYNDNHTGMHADSIILPLLSMDIIERIAYWMCRITHCTIEDDDDDNNNNNNNNHQENRDKYDPQLPPLDTLGKLSGLTPDPLESMIISDVSRMQHAQSEDVWCAPLALVYFMSCCHSQLDHYQYKRFTVCPIYFDRVITNWERKLYHSIVQRSQLSNMSTFERKYSPRNYSSSLFNKLHNSVDRRCAVQESLPQVEDVLRKDLFPLFHKLIVRDYNNLRYIVHNSHLYESSNCRERGDVSLDTLVKQLTTIGRGGGGGERLLNVFENLTHLHINVSYDYVLTTDPHYIYHSRDNFKVDTRHPNKHHRLCSAIYDSKFCDFHHTHNSTIHSITNRHYTHNQNVLVDQIHTTDIDEDINNNEDKNTQTNNPSVSLNISYNCLPLYRLKHLRYLKFDNGFNNMLRIGTLPANLKTIDLGLTFNQPLCTVCTCAHYNNNRSTIDEREEYGVTKQGQRTFVLALPNKLKHLILGDTFNQCINSNVLPQTLESIKVGNAFNSPIIDLFQLPLKTLNIGDRFNLQPGKMPSQLETLSIGKQFTQPLHKLPETLKSLELGERFNLRLDSVISRCIALEKLNIHGMYNFTLFEGYKWTQPTPFASQFYNLTHLLLEEYNQPLTCLPPRLVFLGFGSQFNQSLGNGVLLECNELKFLYLGSNFNQPVDHLLPEGLKMLLFGDIENAHYYYRTDIQQILNASTREKISKLTASDCYISDNRFSISVTSDFNHTIDHLPPSLKMLCLGSDFNQSISQLPDGLERLILGDSFNRSLKQLPSTLKLLYVGDSFNRRIHKLPDGLEILCIGDSYNQPVRRLPSHLKYLGLGHTFNKPLIFSSNNPKNQKEDEQQQQHVVDRNLKNIVYVNEEKEDSNRAWIDFSKTNHDDSGVFMFLYCPQLQYLILGDDFNREVHHLPPSLLHLQLGMYFKRSLDSLPRRLKVLLLEGLYNNPIHTLPNTLRVLKLSTCFNQPTHDWPDDLKLLCLGKAFNQDLNALPEGLEELYLGTAFNRPIDDRLPLTLKILKLGRDFNQRVNHLPRLETLCFGARFNQSMDYLPTSLIYLTLSPKCKQPFDQVRRRCSSLYRIDFATEQWSDSFHD